MAFPLSGLLVNGLKVRIASISSGDQSDNSFMPSLNLPFSFSVLLLNSLTRLKLFSKFFFFLLNSVVFLTSLLYLATCLLNATSGVSFRSSSCSFFSCSLVFLLLGFSSVLLSDFLSPLVFLSELLLEVGVYLLLLPLLSSDGYLFEEGLLLSL